VTNVMAKVEKKALYRSAALAKAEEWSSECSSLDQECTLNRKDHVTIVVVRVKSLTRPTSARLAMERKSRKKRRLSRLKSTRAHQTTTSTSSTAKLTSSQEWKLEMSSFLAKNSHTRDSKGRVLTF